MQQPEPFRVRHGDVRMEGVLHRPVSRPAPGPAVLMYPGATGTGPSFRRAARSLADLGYLAIEVEMYGIEADISTPEAAGQHFMALLSTPDVLRSRAGAWLDAVRALPEADPARIAAIGYCFGGKCVLELARSGAELGAVISYHGLATTHAPMEPGACRTTIAVWSGGLDPYVPLADFDGLRSELDNAGARYQMSLFSFAQHSFTDPDHEETGLEGIKYDPLAHRVSWAATLAMLDETIGGPG